ncbi:hypothetical protein PF005_g19856 [Phytophthora fragariae]|uniref:RxLR effector protein n=1 Tax=Phytophthora fragariae TaxID=53985 RepID=A0A6A3IR80_9STRA|nr:hypothetical protein PF003_g13827 [Phytophthora fragariae]KAE8935486.1 hypothetical protein PF009_g14569 [Phytophthora fragariae]KAE8984292.1 hypothetical protein PF011_g20835 [Phytophthora fragariae]KAE9082291.1 hypothetical protein PF010_g21642 [Phytophthora fragariae]KAE9093614.1 hypothetical protein PF007_g18068 [Phytophthora fragariae]
MRTYYVLFLCATIFASGSTQSTASELDEGMISTMASPELIHSGQHTRFLRAQKGDEGDDEDRVLTGKKTPLTWEKLEDILTNAGGIQARKFASWKKKELDAQDIMGKIRAFDSVNERHRAIALQYGAYLKGQQLTVYIQRMERPPSPVARSDTVPNENSLIVKGLWSWLTGS